MKELNIDVSRRRFIAGAGALIIGASLPLKKAMAAVVNPQREFEANAFVQIGLDGIVTVLSKHTEVGQGVYTGMATLIAEELDADWSQIRVVAAPVDTSVYKNLSLGIQGTGGSSSIANAYEQMRRMGAAARSLMVSAAAKLWNKPASEITIQNGVVMLPGTDLKAGFGELVAIAAQLTPPDPASLVLKKPEQFTYIGKVKGPHRIDSRDKVTGKAMYSQDINKPGMLTVTIKRPPLFGSKLVSFDDSLTRQYPGVVEVKATPSGVAVYATSTWAAIKGRDLLKASWDDTKAEHRNTEEIFQEFRTTATTPGVLARKTGDAQQAFSSADKIIEAEYTFPYLAHAPMEPLNGYIFWDGDSVYAEYGCQIQTLDQAQLTAAFGLPPEKVKIETILAGGSFGRRIDFGNPKLGPDLAADMAAAALAIGPGKGLKVVWTREDDIRGGWYRPMVLHKMRAAIHDNKISAWTNTVAGHSFFKDSAFDAAIKNGLDPMLVEGASEPPYTFANFQCDAHIVPGHVPVTSLRSVGSTHTCHAVEAFIDKVLDALGQDPVEGRLALMTDAPREAGTLRAVAKAANWTGAMVGNNRARGVAVAKAFNTRVAQIAEVSIGENGQPRVHKVWCAVDCGIAVNPDVIKAQIEGGIGYGLSVALYGNITLKEGHVEQSNFNNYRPLRINEMPEIEVIIIPSDEAPTGVGELGVPPIAPAVANALAKLGRSRDNLSLPLHKPGSTIEV
ncbi:xanthine dehydrogenase family protein molybdopterin-binding subunit [Pantoea cypripedii]|uniref:Aldehyde oxidase n=1 Tax=Pantoea cypripedii TaxID=55209 RepID=A0A1X1EM08_PANCY|nr:molybdopterin cofactor-binding domain-containing protein [Pantoea cypripedii]MBP2199184.1 isoquinoline 1-oxidoreductase beta subunit [Pantoea cypripedii]ORM89990.1 aldehyde oxidase [Pantoea cypripedii]